MGDVKETSYIHTLEDDYGVITTNEYVYINRFLKLAGERPDEVEVMHHPDDNNGVLMVKVPKKWFKITPPNKRVYTDEQREAMEQHMRDVRACKKQAQTT